MESAITIPSEKLSQAVSLVQSSDADVWLTFVRETAGGGDPVLPFLIDGGLTWHSALLITKTGRKIAVVGNFDADPLKAPGDWDEVIPYVQGIKQPLLDTLERLVPENGKIALNYSENDVKADGLTHGMYLLLKSYFKGTRFEKSLISAEPIVMSLRSQKSPEEMRRILNAIAHTQEIFREVGDYAEIGMSEKHIFDWIQAKAKNLGLGFSWDPVQDPIVNSGPNSMVGHGVPSETITLQKGHIFHIDLGLTCDCYSSDIQRCWFVGENIPHEVQEALHTVNGAITAASRVLKPGMMGWQVDAAARNYLIEKGFPEYLHATGHQVGRVAHDGGAILGPKWERYGDTPSIPIQKDEVYTIELGVNLEGRGYLGIEEMVMVTADGCDWMTDRQWELPTIS